MAASPASTLPPALAKEHSLPPPNGRSRRLLLCEIFAFGILGRNFFTWTNLR